MVGRCSTSAIERAQNVGSPPKDAHASGLPDVRVGLKSPVNPDRMCRDCPNDRRQHFSAALG